jgi:hypothetical protein
MPDTPTLEEVAQLQDTIELLEENLLDATLALDNTGWLRLGEYGVFSAQERRRSSALARIMSVADPLISRAVNLRIAYVWGQGVSIQAKQEDGAEQDVNAVVQAFLDDPSNRASFTSGQAREELERRLATGGEVFHVLFTAPLSGRVQVRNMPSDEVEDIITNPEDGAEPWFYKRVYSRRIVEAGYAGTRTRSETRTAYYPAMGYRPRLRPSTIDGRPVEWDMPVLHTVVNRPEGSQRGVGDVYAALPWAQGYKEFLEDWARLVKALSRFAFRATAKTRRGAAQVRDKLTAAPMAPASMDGPAGQTVITGEGQTFEAIGKSGATIDSNSGRPLAAMVAAATDVPVTMLLADPGVTGARATAETLDDPLWLMAQMRRDLHADLIRTVLGYVIDQAVKAPQGPLKGTRKIDPVSGREVITLRGDQDRTIDVDWPDLTGSDVKSLVDAIVAADGTQTVPPLVTLRLLLVALGVEDIDEVLDMVTDDNGDFVFPADAAAATAQQNVVAAGNLPGQQPPPADQQQQPPAQPAPPAN